MKDAGDCKRGAKILYRNEPHIVVEYQHTKPGKGAAFVRLKLRNLLNGSQFEQTFRPEERFEEPDLNYKNVQYLYNDGDHYVFMDQESFEQIELEEALVRSALSYLKEQASYTLFYWGDRLLEVMAPIHMELEVVDTPPGVKGDTAQGGSKPATLETGLVLQVPLFVNIGDIIKVDTREDLYIERVQR
jgi:elongation factor P